MKYDRGTFVEGADIRIEPAANGTFVLWRHKGGMQAGMMGFSSAVDMLRFLQSEYLAPDAKTLPAEDTLGSADC